MAFGELNISKVIARNSPKYSTIIEPFADNGAFALFLKKKNPKKHILNYFDNDLFKIMNIIKNMSSTDFNILKNKVWIGSKKNYENALKISAEDGLDFFYKYFYLKHFTDKGVKDKQVFDVLKTSLDVKNKMYDFKKTKAGLKNVDIVNLEYSSAIKLNGENSFYILVPKGDEQINLTENNISSLNNFFYASKLKQSDLILETAKNKKENFVSAISTATIMGGTSQVITNYKTSIDEVDVELIETYE